MLILIFANLAILFTSPIKPEKIDYSEFCSQIQDEAERDYCETEVLEITE